VIAAFRRSDVLGPGPSLRVLVVDDEALIRWSLSETLSERGHLVSEAGDGQTALRMLTTSSAPFDVVLLDYHLPDSHDLVLLSTIRQVAPNTAVIMMTAYSGQEMVDAAVRIGAHRVLVKPFEVHDMATLVLEAHARRR
jgi:DNA-binding NtrC family response regulator